MIIVLFSYKYYLFCCSESIFVSLRIVSTRFLSCSDILEVSAVIIRSVSASLNDIPIELAFEEAAIKKGINSSFDLELACPRSWFNKRSFCGLISLKAGLFIQLLSKILPPFPYNCFCCYLVEESREEYVSNIVFCSGDSMFFRVSTGLTAGPPDGVFFSSGGVSPGKSSR